MSKSVPTARATGQPALPPFVLSRRIMVLANLLKRGAGIRYRRLLGLPQGEWGVLAQLGEREPRTLGDLAASMGLDITQISRAVTSLVARGLVTRIVNPDNNREVLIAMTDKGEAANAVIVKTGSAINDKLLSGLTTKERKLLSDQIARFTLAAETLLVQEQMLNAGPPRKTAKPAKAARRPLKRPRKS